MKRKTMKRAINGWLVLDKPPALGSTQAVARVKHLFKARKAGHAGTLDPLASGVLPIALGEATKTVAFAMEATKTYCFTVRWGIETDSDDFEGDVVARSPHRPKGDAIRACLAHFTGAIMQTPPAFSALKIDGRRAYDIARAGESPDLSARRVSIKNLVLECARPDEADFRVTCGKGTYIRALARDMGRFLGTRGTVARLRRVRVGNLCEKHALGLELLDELRHSDDDLVALDAVLLPLTAVLDDIPALAVTREQAIRIGQGQAISTQAENAFCGDEHDRVLACENGKPVALGTVEGQIFRPARVFNA